MSSTIRGQLRARVIALIAGLTLGARALDLATAPAETPPPLDDSEAALLAAWQASAAAALNHRTGATVMSPKADVAFLDPPSLFRRGRVVALATPLNGRYRDLWRFEARATPNGRIFDVAWAVNLSRTSDANDRLLAVAPDAPWAATAIFVDDQLAAVEVRDFAGVSAERDGTATWPWLQRAMAAITNAEQTGDVRGIGLQHIDVSPGVTGAFTLAFDGSSATVALSRDERPFVSFDTAGVFMARGPDVASHGGRLTFTLAPPEQKMQMEMLNWIADRGRGFADQGLAPEWLGSSVEFAKEVYFEAKAVKASVDEMSLSDATPEEGTPVAAPAAVAAREESVQEAVQLAKRQLDSEDIAWPPAPMSPLLDPPWEGEGLWSAVGPDRMTAAPHGRPLVYETFVRPESDYARKAVRLFAWDPRYLELRMRSGTHEPVPQTAARGDGRIPREGDDLSRVIMAFNGGFQTTHRAFGMMVDRHVLLKPRTYGATIALLSDGRPALGTWMKRAAIPPEFVSFRQNLEPLIEDGVFNAYRRVRFGGTENVAGAKDGWTVRSAICVTVAGHFLYGYAEYANEKALAQALKHAGCVYAIHLDMNPGHTGLEFYRHLVGGETPEVAENVREFPVVAAPGDAGLASGGSVTPRPIRIEGRQGHAKIRHMNRPTRYLGTDYRDFFYLVTRPALPPPLLPGQTVRWLTTELPIGPERPPRAALGSVSAGSAAGVEVLVVDSSAARVMAAATPEPTRPFATIPWRDAAASTDSVNTVLPGGRTLVGKPLAALGPDGETGRLAAGVNADGMVVFARGPTAAVVLVAMRALGVATPSFSAGSAGPFWMYAAASDGSPGLLELEPGQDQGVVVAGVTDAESRLGVWAVPRPPRWERYWPDANPYLKPASSAAPSAP